MYITKALHLCVSCCFILFYGIVTTSVTTQQLNEPRLAGYEAARPGGAFAHALRNKRDAAATSFSLIEVTRVQR